MSTGCLQLEIKRAIRAGRFMIFTVAFPILMFVFLAGTRGGGDLDTPTALMVNMTTCVLVLAGWTLALGALVVRRYRQDSART